MVLLPEQLPLRNIPPSVCHYAILQRTSLTIGEGFTRWKKTNGFICNNDAVCSSNGQLELVRCSNPKPNCKTWGNLAPNTVFRCTISVSAKRDFIVDGTTVSELLKKVLPRTGVQLLSDEVLPSLVFLISTQGRNSAFEVITKYSELDSALSFNPINGDCRIEIAHVSNPTKVIDKVYACFEGNHLLDTRMAYTFEVFASIRTFLTLQSLAIHHNVSD
ncbi:hypothetical protein LSM04_008473 [Trypanosoma melophagium]|uniref:uncharacterized protein n=1 Tax=Trypanosoma melophagium TaxID=715481 RepID=UPI00351A1DD8|nr:hypothetical protein LSM04_008473 [Trypanosoma melophagium]